MKTLRFGVPALAATLTASSLLLAGCVSNDAATGNVVSVSSGDDVCEVSASSAPSGTITFSVTNDGSHVTEFYLLAEDGLRIVGEVENIGPGLTRDLVLQAPAGKYFTSCKPGMAGDGIRAEFTVTESGAEVGPKGEVAEQLDKATSDYIAYVKDQVSTLLAGTEAFADAYVAGDDNAARELYAATRVHWERVEPVAESFGDLDPLLDAREADLGEGDTWSGWHYIEKDLWQPTAADNGGVEYTPLTQAQREEAAAYLVELTEELLARVSSSDFTFEAFQISNGAKELLDEVASGKVTGEEEIWSHTDLWDFAANVEGAKVALDVLRPVAESGDPELVTELDERFAALDSLLATHGSYDQGFTPYDELSAEEVNELAAAVDALSEPLSRLTAVIAAV